MTDHLHALAMRTKAATDIGELGDDLAYISDFGQRLSERAYEISREILALPLEADHAALLAEAVKLPEIAALIKALEDCRDELDAYSQQEYPLDHPVHERYRQRDYDANPARIALLALETP